MTPDQREEAKAACMSRINHLQTERSLKVDWADRLMKDLERAQTQITAIEEKIAGEKALMAVIDAPSD